MKNNHSKYLNSILTAIGLKDGLMETSLDILEKAGTWAIKTAWSPNAYQAVALRPVLETLEDKTPSRYFQPQPLSLHNDFFPKLKSKPSDTQLNEQLENLRNALNNADNEQLLTALEFHGSTLAVSKENNDIPLFDFIKTTTAIAHCLENGEGKLRLAGGSISGIQSYLYDIVSKRAGKLLKGRSFYLQLLSDGLATRFLEKFGLSEAHIVYSSGGGFYVLMPDNDAVEGDFEDFKTKVIQQIYEAHKTNLTCEFAISDSFDENAKTPKIWEELLQKLSEAKSQRLSHNPALLSDLLGVVDEGGADDDENSKFTRDAVTNEQILKSEAETFDDDSNLVHRSTNAQQYLGRDLRDAKFWITSKSRVSRDYFPDRLGYFHLLVDKLPEVLPTDAKVQVLNQPIPTTDFVFYGGNKIPVNKKTETIDGETYYEGDPKTFDQLALGDRLDRLGILRMDVDNLGKTFSQNVGTPASFARYAAVSRSLDWFFKGYLNTIHSEVCEASQQKFSEKTVIIYSGGDDLFIVGRWLEVLDMACRIREEFKEWSGGRLTISGGVAILPDKFPVMQGAKLAGEKEKAAKSYSLAGQKLKNAVCFFDQTLNWENEMPIVFDLKNMLERWLGWDKEKAGIEKTGEKYVDNSILKKIDQHAESRKEQEKHKESPRWIWHMVYDFGRFAQKRGLELLAPEIRDLARKATLEDFDFKQKKRAVPFLYLLQTAARWVELERRTLKNNDSNP